MSKTSIMAVEFEDGVIMGADSRTTTGSYIANRVSDKITHITDNIWVCRSGSAADTQAISDYVRWYLNMYSIEFNELPLVKTAANITRQLCYDNKEMLLAAIIIGGWDHIEGGQVYQIPLGGMLHRQDFAISGSGSSYITGYCDKHFRKGMNQNDCLNFVTESLALAMARDGSSGGVIRTTIIKKDGYTRNMIPGNKLPVFYEG